MATTRTDPEGQPQGAMIAGETTSLAIYAQVVDIEPASGAGP